MYYSADSLSITFVGRELPLFHPYLRTPTSHSVVYNPFLDQLYHAVTGQGAYLNKTQKLPLSQPHPLPLNSLGEALIAVEWGSDRSKEVSTDMQNKSSNMSF
jgi:fructose-1,6-bisphosphatase/inositol monophosphatase family enzyme